MKIWKMVASAALVVSTLSGCGGGGGAPAPASTVVSGVATKGPFLTGSTVQVFSVVGGQKGALLATAHTTDDLGNYRADLGSYSGPVIAEASGSYRDEATGHDVPVALSAPIRAALPMASGSVTLPVTALTELAVQKAATLAPEAITAANALVSGLFKVDIIATVPVAPTSAALAGASQAQKDYTLALAALSQMASEGNGADDTEKLKNALGSLSQGISSSGMSGATVTAFQGALDHFVVNENNHTGISDTSATSLVNAGTLSRSYAVTLTGSGVRSLAFGVVLPEGMSVNYDHSDGSLLDSSLMVPAGSPMDLMATGNYTSGTAYLGFLSSQGFAPGVVATITVNLQPGVTPPAELQYSELVITDAKAHPVSGAGITIK